MSQTADHLAALRTLVTRIVRECTGMNERLAVPIAHEITRGLQQLWGGREVWIPSPRADERADEIRQALEVGLSPKEIVAAYGVSRASVYRAMRRGERGGPECP